MRSHFISIMMWGEKTNKIVQCKTCKTVQLCSLCGIYNHSSKKLKVELPYILDYMVEIVKNIVSKKYLCTRIL